MLALSFNSIITDLMPSLIGVDFLYLLSNYNVRTNESSRLISSTFSNTSRVPHITNHTYINAFFIFFCFFIFLFKMDYVHYLKHVLSPL